MKNKHLNEATLESRIASILKTTFPTFEELKVKHQENFSIKFGHHNVTVDLKEPSTYPSRAIYDILLTTEDEKTNLILLELKKENKEITHEDIDQGISYARLIHPMPPITLLSNGVKNIFYDTHTKTEITQETIDFKFIQHRLDIAFSLARNDFKHAVNILLNNDPKIISQIINDISASRFDRLKGELSDFTKPICEDFIIDREYLRNIKKSCNEYSLIGVVGPAFSGKTNILYDFFRTYHNSSNAIYYMDCKDINYSIFQQLSNHLTRQCNFLIDKEKIREWIISSISNIDNGSFTFLIDNFDLKISNNLNEEINELIDLLRDSKHSIIFTIDLVNYQILSKDKFRNSLTFFGRETHVININELNIHEFEKSSQLLFNVSKALFEHGAYFAIEYRHPRILRFLAAFYSNKKEELTDGQVFTIIAVPDYNLLKLIVQNNSFNTELKELYKKLAIAFLKDRVDNEDLILSMASTYGGISLTSIEDVFKDSILELLNSGFVNKHELQNGQSVIYPKIPELITFYGIEHITSLLINEKEEISIEEVYKKFEKLCFPFINSDIVGTGVLLNIAYAGKIDLFSQLVQYQKTLNPKKGKISDGTKVAMLINEKTKVNIEFKGDDFKENFIGDFFPHLVLSQLAGYPLRIENSENGNEYSFHLQLLLDLAISPISMVRITNFSFDNLPPIKNFEFKKIGTVISGRSGIIEPLVQSIQKCFYEIPDEIEKLYCYAFDNKIFPVIWRIYLAIRNEVESGDDDIASKAKEFMERFYNEFPELLENVLKEE